MVSDLLPGLLVSASALALITFVCTYGSALAGAFLRDRLPPPHLTKESQDVVRLGVGLVATMTALLLGMVLGPVVIRRLTELKIGQPIREYGVQEHLAKRGTPTMGGALILLAIAISTLLWFDWSNRFVWIVMLVTFGFGAIGWVDDWRKVVHKDPEGMRSREKYFWQSVIGLVAALSGRRVELFGSGRFSGCDQGEDGLSKVVATILGQGLSYRCPFTGSASNW